MSKKNQDSFEAKPMNYGEDLKLKIDKNYRFMMEEAQKLDSERGSLSMISGTQVPVDGGVKMRLDALADVNSKNREFSIRPWNYSNTNAIVKALQEAQVRFNPQVDDRGIIRIKPPVISVERRKEFSAAAKNLGENSKKVVRNARRDIRARVDQDFSAKLISKEEKWRVEKDLDSTTAIAEEDIDRAIAKIIAKIMEE